MPFRLTILQRFLDVAEGLNVALGIINFAYGVASIWLDDVPTYFEYKQPVQLRSGSLELTGGASFETFDYRAYSFSANFKPNANFKGGGLQGLNVGAKITVAFDWHTGAVRPDKSSGEGSVNILEVPDVFEIVGALKIAFDARTTLVFEGSVGGGDSVGKNKFGGAIEIDLYPAFDFKAKIGQIGLQKF